MKKRDVNIKLWRQIPHGAEQTGVILTQKILQTCIDHIDVEVRL
jgi:hypothetical protein